MNALTTTENHAIAAVPQMAGPMAAAIQALQAGMTIEQMQGLMGLQKDWEANEARKAYVADMAAFKLHPPVILKTKEVSFNGTHYMHATLGGVTEAIVAALAQHGFSHSWSTEQKTDGQIHVTCRLTHRLGHSEVTALNSGSDQSGKKNSIQAMASTVTYLQRYTLLAACGLATMDMGDDDGHSSGDEQADYNAAEQLALWTVRVDAAVSLESLRVTRSAAAEAFQKAGDVASWNVLKAYAANKKAVFEAATQGATV